MPGKLEDWRNDFSLEKLFINPEKTEACYCILYNNQVIGQVTYRSDEKIVEDKIASTNYIHLVLDGVEDAGNDCGLGTIFIGDDIQCVTEAFGKPINENIDEEIDFCYYQYKIEDNKSIGFYSHDGKIDKITIINE